MSSDGTRRQRIDEAVALKRSRDLGEAIRRLEGLVAEDRDDTYALGHLAHALLLRKSPREALEVAQGALERAPGNAFLHSVRGDALVRLKRWEEAVPDLEAALGGGFRSAYLYARLAEARARSGDADGARSTLEHGLSAFPGDGKLLLALGRLERAAGDSAASERHIEEAAEKLPGDGFAYKEMIASRARAKGGGEQAIAEIRRLLRIPTQARNPHLHDELGRLLSDAKDHEGAVAAWRNAYQLSPETALFHHRLAFALVRAGHDSDAITEIESCLDAAPEDPALHRSYIAARRRRGQLDEAHAFYLRLFQRHPEARKLFGYLRKVAAAAGEAAGDES